jgi:hypothetical protein
VDKLILVTESVRVNDGRGERPRRRPRTLYADSKYDMPLNRFYIAKAYYHRSKTAAEEEAGKAHALRREDVRQGQVIGREVQRVDQIIQEGGDEIREATDPVHGASYI